MTIDQRIPAPIPASASLGERIAQLQARRRSVDPASDGDALALESLWIGGMIQPVLTEGADAGINGNILNGHERGLLIEILPWTNMRENDWVEVFWGGSNAVASAAVVADQVDNNFTLYVAASHALEGIHPVHYAVRRYGSGNTDKSQPLNVLTRRLKPGGIDPDPVAPGHQALLPVEPELPPGGIIDEDTARNGVKVTVQGYPNMRLHDKLDLSWGGVMLEHLVNQTDIDNAAVVFHVTEETILAAGDSEQLVLVYKIRDEVHNLSDGWSMRRYVHVEIGTGLFDSPIINNPDQDADPWDVIDLDTLGEDDLEIQVMAVSGGAFKVGDEVALSWTGTTADGEVITVEPPPEKLTHLPRILDFMIPNADVRRLGQGRCVAVYTVIRDGSAVGVSRRTFATFLGAELRLPKPYSDDAINGSLPPDLASANVVVPGDALEAGDVVLLTWHGTRANGTPLIHTISRGITGSGAGKPLNLSIAGAEYLAPLDGGSLTLSYTLTKGSGVELKSDAEHLRVGEAQFELPAPTTRPPIEEGLLDPEQIPDPLEIVVAPYTNMKAGQTVWIKWLASSGPNHEDWMPITLPAVGKEIVFTLDRAHILENLGAEVVLSYRVEAPDEPDRESAPVSFRVGAEQVTPPAPSVVEVENGVLDPGDALDGATVRIPVEAGLVFGDYVDVVWQGSGQGGSTRVERQIYQEDEGKALDVVIPYEFVIANADANVVLHYEVFPVQGAVRVSEPITLRVQSVALPLPVIDEAEGSTLNPGDVAQGATVRIDASAHFGEGDEVKVKVVSAASGGSTELIHIVPAGGVGEPVTVTVPYSVIKASSGTTFDLSYEITRKAGGPAEPSQSRTYSVVEEAGSGPVLVMGARFNVNIHMAGTSPRMLSAFDADTRQPMLVEWRYEGSSQWTLRTHWFDTQPWLKLYARSKVDALALNPANIMGNGYEVWPGMAAFVAMRDEVQVGTEMHVDMVGWGDAACGGELDANLRALKDVVEVSAARRAYTVRRRNGQVLSWGARDEGGTTPVADNGDIVEVRGGAFAFAGRKSDGRLIAWGDPGYGAIIPAAVSQHRDYIELCSNGYGFAARRASGYVAAWGDSANGGALLPGQEHFDDITRLSANAAAFMALRESGNSRSVIGWGSTVYGGRVPPEIAELTNVKALGAASSGAFTILLNNGAVRGWGPAPYGGQVPEIIQTLTNIVEVSATWYAFCARLSNGHVVAWGNAASGAQVPEAIARLSNIVQVVGTSHSFAALCRDGTVVAWGNPNLGGDTTPVAAQLVNVLAIYASSQSFTALTADGRVVTWGVAAGGGDSSKVQAELRGKVTTGRTMSLADAAMSGRAQPGSSALS